jgi:hypothetical protein
VRISLGNGSLSSTLSFRARDWATLSGMVNKANGGRSAAFADSRSTKQSPHIVTRTAEYTSPEAQLRTAHQCARSRIGTLWNVGIVECEVVHDGGIEE